MGDSEDKLDIILNKLNKLDTICDEIQNIKIDICNYKTKSEELNKKYDELQTQLNKQQNIINNMELHIKKRNLIFCGLKVSNKSNQEVFPIILETTKNYLGVQLNEGDIEEIRSLDKKDNERRRIVVTFSSMSKRNQIFYNRKKLSGSNIYINEDMTHKQLEERKELLEAKKEHRENGIISKIVRNKLVIITETQNKKREREVRKSDDSPSISRQPTKQLRTTSRELQHAEENDSAFISKEAEKTESTPTKVKIKTQSFRNSAPAPQRI